MALPYTAINMELEMIRKRAIAVTFEAGKPIDKQYIPSSPKAKALQDYLYEKPIGGEVGDAIASLLSIIVGDTVAPVKNPMRFRNGLCITALPPAQAFGYTPGETCLFIDHTGSRFVRCTDNGEHLRYGDPLPTRGGKRSVDIDTNFVRLATEPEITELFRKMQGSSNPKNLGTALKRYFQQLF